MRVVVLTTGGTIATATDHETGRAVPRIEGAALLGGWRPPSGIDLDFEAPFTVPSSFIDLPRMWQLKRHVARILESGRSDAVVLTHGTDTLEETAFLLDLCLPASHAVVVTGAMRLSSQPGADGPANLRGAILTAAHLARHGGGRAVVLNDEIHAPRYVSKLHTTSVASFSSLPFGPLGIVQEDAVYMPLALRAPLQVPLARLPDSEASPAFPEIELVKVVAGGSPAGLQHAVDRGIRGIVLEGTGGGHVPPSFVPVIEAALRRDAVVVMASRCPVGFPLRDTYSIDGGERELRALGVVHTRLNGQKARVLLIVSALCFEDAGRIRAFVDVAP